MNDTLRIRLGAVTLALLTLAAVILRPLTFNSASDLFRRMTESHGLTRLKELKLSMWVLDRPLQKLE